MTSAASGQNHERATAAAGVLAAVSLPCHCVLFSKHDGVRNPRILVRSRSTIPLRYVPIGERKVSWLSVEKCKICGKSTSMTLSMPLRMRWWSRGWGGVILVSKIIHIYEQTIELLFICIQVNRSNLNHICFESDHF